VLILIVEDDLGVAVTLREALARHNHESLTASTALAGLDLLRTHPIDLILLDINLPGGLSGYAACEVYKSVRPHLPVILITGAFTSDADARLANRLGASGFLRKPFAFEELLAMILRVLAAPKAKPPDLYAFDCEECGAESRVRQQVGDSRRLRCPNCGAIRVVQMEDLRPLPEPRLHRPPTAFQRRILVVDNAEHFRLYLLDLLTDAGHYVVTARDGQEAFRLAQEWAPDLVITEILLPGMDGLALCQQIKAHPRLSGTPVLIVTGLKSEDYRLLGQQARVDLFMVKPIRAEDFLEKVHALISRSSR
jgi:DNA-binding response OmpR family regulator